jgi:hypothetical protein
MELSVLAKFGHSFEETEGPLCICDSCAADIGKVAIWQQVLF